MPSKTEKKSEKIALLTLTTSSVRVSKARTFPCAFFKVDVSSTDKFFSSNDPGGKKLAEELNKELITIRVTWDFSSCELCKTIPHYSNRLRLRLTSGENNILKMLRDRFKNEIQFSVYLTPSVKGETGPIGPLISSERMTICHQTDSCSSTHSPISVFLVDYIRVKQQWTLTIKIHVPDKLAAGVGVDVEPTDFQLDEARTLKVLEEELYTDVTILAGNGAEIKAHKAYLSAGSPVLEATFKTKMKESASGTLDMKDLTEKGVRAFLRYLYSKDLTGPLEDIEVAYDMLYAAHKYHVPKLETLMATRLAEADDKDFGVELAFRIYIFVKLWNPTSNLKKKAIRVLKCKWDELVESQDYQELFKDGPNSPKAREFLEDIGKSQVDFYENLQPRTEIAPASKEKRSRRAPKKHRHRNSKFDQKDNYSPNPNDENFGKSVASVDADGDKNGEKKDRKETKVQCCECCVM